MNMNIFRVSSALRRSVPRRIISSSLEQSMRQPPPRLRFFSAAGNDTNADTNANINTDSNTDSYSNTDSHSHSHSDPSPTDFFRLFGLPRKFGIQQSELKGTYLRLMNEYHPDKQRHVVATENDNNNDNDNDNDNAPLLTAETITHAYQILRAPHTRAAHWLELHGCPLYDDDAKASAKASANENENENENGSGQTELVGMEFLMEMMEWRERIEDATTMMEEDSGMDPSLRQNRLEALAEETKPLRENCEAALEALLLDSDDDDDDDDDDDESINGNDNGNGNDNDNNSNPKSNRNPNPKSNRNSNSEATLAEARKLVAQLQYWNRLDETLREAMDV